MRKRLLSLRTFRKQTRDIYLLNNEHFLTDFLSSSPNIYLAIYTAAYDILAASKMNHKKNETACNDKYYKKNYLLYTFLAYN